MSSNKNEQCYNDFVSKIIIVIEGKKVHLSSESTSLADFGVHISQLNLIDKEGNHMISQIQQPITEYKRVIPKNIHKEILDGNSNFVLVDRKEFEDLKARVEFLEKENVELRRENAELRKQVLELQRENAELRSTWLQRENAELRKQVITLQNVCDKYFNLYGPLPAN
jgi:regulator of replication initiation timing